MAYFYDEIYNLVNKIKLYLIPISILIILGAISEYKIFGAIASYRTSNLVNIPVLCIVVFGMYSYIKNRTTTDLIVRTIGNMSMGIYLVHPMVLFLFMRYLPHSFWATIWLPIIYILVLLTSFLVIKLIQCIPMAQYIIPVPIPKKSVTNNTTEFTSSKKLNF